MIRYFLLLFCLISLNLGAQDTTKFISVNYHFMLKSDSSGNFNEYWDGLKDSSMTGYQRAKLVIEKANFELAHNKKMFLPSGNQTDVLPINIQYVLCGVYFHHNDTFYSANHYDGWGLFERYGVNPKSEINIFNIPADENGTGIANQILSPYDTEPSLACKVKDYISYQKFPDWSVAFGAGNLNHEIGHLLGLYHTWDTDDGCKDTPMAKYVNGQFRQCWGFKNGDPVCGDWRNVSNNIMDYNEYFPHAYSPCQLQKIHDILNHSGSNFILKMDKNAPPKALFDLFLGKNNHLTIDGNASWNEVKYEIEIYDLQKDMQKPMLTIESEGEVERFDLSNYFKFNAQKNYKITLKVFSENEEIDELTKLIFIK